jgi:hypothetical protein
MTTTDNAVLNIQTPQPVPVLAMSNSAHNSPQSTHSVSATNTPTASTRKACDSCRLSKARCEPLSATEAATLKYRDDINAICQRCAKTGRRCVFGERSRRKKRRRTESGDEGGEGNADRDKVSRLEQKLSILEARLGTASKLPSEEPQSLRRDSDDPQRATATGFASLLAGSQASRADANLDYGYYTPPTTSSVPVSMPASASSSAPIQTASGSPPTLPPPVGFANPLLFFCPDRRNSRPKPKLQLGPDVLSRNVLNLNTATMLYEHFINNMLPHFPFYTPHESLGQIRHQKPLLFLAILAAAAASTGAIDLHNKLLDDAYATLSRFILHGEKTLELVQAIIITITWYHPPSAIEQSRLWMLTMQASAIAVDLNTGSSTDLDERRALLTCYSCNACISIVLRRPIFLRYGRKIQESIELVENTGLEGDRILCAYVTLVWYMEEAFSACGIIDGDYTAAPNPQAMGYVLDNFWRRVSEYQKKMTKVLNNSPLRASMEVAHQGAILQAFALVFDIPGGNVSAHARLLQAAHETIEIFLSCPVDTLKASPFHVFSRMANACSVLIRLASSLVGERNIAPELRMDGRIPLEHLNDGRLEHLRIPHYLSLLIERLRLLLGPSSSATNSGSRTLVMSLALLEGMRVYYNTHYSPPAPEVAAASILCGTPTPATYPQYQQPLTLADFDVNVSQEDIESFFYGADSVIMLGANGGNGLGWDMGEYAWAGA